MTDVAQQPRETRETFWRTLQTFCATRVVITVVLLAYFGINAIRATRAGEAFADWQSCAAYLLVAIGFGVLSTYVQRRLMLQLLTQLVFDIAAISFLYIASGGARSGLAILYLFPLSGAAVLAPLVLALFFVSIVTLILLGESLYQLLYSLADTTPSQAGLYGAAFFAAIFVINRLAAKVIKQEDLVAQRGRDLQLQEAINRLVIADMGDGILVVGDDTEVFAGNPAAEHMLGMSIAYGQPRYKLTDLPALGPIADAFFAWQQPRGAGSDATSAGSSYVRIKPVDRSGPSRDRRRELAAHLKLRFASVESLGLSNDRTVIFLQDVSEIENQAQQLKLASMGRLTASIAHEVRNPLSAISHAASLLSEDLVQPTEKRLLNIISDNVVRLNRMIEDILKLSRKAHTHAEPLRLASFLAEVLIELRETHNVAPDMIAMSSMDYYQVRFDPLHLREVVLNLVSNALRYASGLPGSIRLMGTSPTAERLELHVQDDGPAITPEVRAHLFEPFYTTSSKGTGLGLYVARELCLNNGAMLDYEYRMELSGDGRDEPSGRFVITFAVARDGSLAGRHDQ
ncbi:two-component system sensor histidine kinase NtrB [Noviherbaspirillum saxi]|uniref:histidine kinase n=1 Tax=Noviherbaspirillum saxi TaxID=2320863 RepID=A0A3A3GA53_9BURK|nr:ATP-binding protein [Noviherbaspirillum saxi]RJF97759.1 two-component sensor histidine kinase [Noviherbaspirillum saxi]